jgi:SAM-dependent methyltransferase
LKNAQSCELFFALLNYLQNYCRRLGLYKPGILRLHSMVPGKCTLIYIPKWATMNLRPLRPAQAVPQGWIFYRNNNYRNFSNHIRITTKCAAQDGPGSVRREVLTPSQRTKLNPQDDRYWYDRPRLVHHSDAIYRSQVTQLYRERIPAGGAVLDLCSSWVSHLPPEVEYAKVVGHGLNAEELARNDRLSQFFVRNLNKEPDNWALESDSFDAVLICCSVQYFQQPERVFSEIFRVLKPRGCIIVTFTHNLFYEKAVAAWRDGSMYTRTQLVKEYLMAVDGFTEPEALESVSGGTQLSPFEAAATVVQKFFSTGSSGADPFHAVVAYKLKKD